MRVPEFSELKRLARIQDKHTQAINEADQALKKASEVALAMQHEYGRHVLCPLMAPLRCCTALVDLAGSPAQLEVSNMLVEGPSRSRQVRPLSGGDVLPRRARCNAAVRHDLCVYQPSFEILFRYAGCHL